LLGLPLGAAEHHTIIGVAHQLPHAPVGEFGIQHVQVNIRQQRGEHASNALGNFCFDVTLSYRRLELPRRVTQEVRHVE
jgi:hypothetical protein